MSKSFSKFIAILLCVALVDVTAAPADTTKYLFKKEPRRRALIIGNSDYIKHETIPSAKKDAEEMESKLKDLGFAPATHFNVASVADFEDKVISPFRLTMEEGDIVVVYFSGHGFGYSAFNFLAPITIPTSIAEKDLVRHAIAIDSIEEMLIKRDPGMLIFIIDACRNFSNIIAPDTRTGDHVVKSMTIERISSANYRTNTMISFASRKGYSAAGSTNPGKNSLFTERLLSHLFPKPKEIRDIFRDVAAEVEVLSKDNQQPGLVDDSKSEFYLQIPSSDILASHQETWSAALSSGEREAIDIFRRRFATSLHAAAARQWLIDDENRRVDEDVRFTNLSPLAVDRVWANASAPIISTPRLGLAFPRVASVTPKMQELEDKEIGILKQKSRSTNEKKLIMGRSVFEESQSLVAHKDAVAIRDFKVRGSPSDSAPIIETIPTGSPLIIKGVRGFSKGQATWLAVQAPGTDQDRFIKVTNSDTSTNPVALGQAIKEIKLTPEKNFQYLIERSGLENGLREVRNTGRTITWVSLAVGTAANIDETEAQIQRLTHATYLLKQSGIDSRRITAVKNVPEVSPKEVRVRIFGVENPGGPR